MKNIIILPDRSLVFFNDLINGETIEKIIKENSAF